MKNRRGVFSGTVALSLFCQNMNDHRPLELFHAPERVLKFLYVVAVQGTDIFKPKVGKKILLNHKPFQTSFEPSNQFSDVIF